MLMNLHDGSELDLGDELTTDGTMSLSPDDFPGCEGPGCAVYINKQEALQVIEHLRRVFALEA